jgi:GR25 family glycosyltransferase involved in LPS biosynthesis
MNELGLCYYYTNLEGKAQILWEKALKNVLTHDEYTMITKNLNFCYSSHQNKYLTYPKDIIQHIMLKNKKKKVNIITFTITTCKRYDLFEKTMNSFLNCCIDYILIDEWVCVDDNSAEEDLNKIYQKYPFFTIIKKTPSQKGHAKSMNIIKNYVKSPYIFHMEDDWQFFAKCKYISNLLKVLEFEGPKCGQVLVNKNYAEILDIDIVGGGVNATNNNIVYLQHEYYQGEDLEKNNKRGLNCFYWPHYSLRPSLLRKSMIDDIGDYNESAAHFEMEYAHRYVQKGYHSCFLDGIYCKHIGKLTFEKKSERPNAYVLNGTVQFENKDEKPSCIPVKSMKIEKYVINLDKRQDRYDSFTKEFGKDEYIRFSGIDGTSIKYSSNIGHIFANNDYNFRQGIVGCAMSHIKLIIQLVSSDCDYYVILEDDAKKTPHYDKSFDKIIKNITSFNLDFLFLFTFVRDGVKQIRDENDKIRIDILDSKEWHRYSYASCAGYIVSKYGAKRFLEFLNGRSLTNAIDTEILNSADKLNVGVISPFLITSELRGNSSDIQNNFIPIDSIDDYISLENEYYTSLGYNIVDDVNKIVDNDVMISDIEIHTNNLTSYKLRDKWVVLQTKKYEYLLENGLRLKKDNEYTI